MAESRGKGKNYPFWQWKNPGKRKKSKKKSDKSYSESLSSMQQDTNIDGISTSANAWKEPVNDGIELSQQQEYVLNLVRQGKNVFYTGNAGTGKTTLLGKIRKCAPEDTFVTALTGVAAVQAGGTTLHSFAGIGLGNGSKEYLCEIVRKGSKAKNWKRAKVLIIDEVSMLDGKLLDKLEYIACNIRGSKLPFGGIQLVLCGDFFQLPPIKKVGETSINYCFQSKAWSKCINHSVELTQIYRQSDPKLIKLLYEVRYQCLSDESLELLQHLRRPIPDHCDIEPTKLYSHNARVNDINNAKLLCLPGEEMIYTAEDHGQSPYVENMSKYVIAMERLVLKKGAQVMLLKNLTEDLINGSRGVVEEFDEDGWPRVKFVDGELKTIKEVEWNLENSHGTVLAVRTQVPLKLAWAITIHKSQGMSIDFLQVDLKNVFSQGQAYVALSRARTLEGLQVLSFDVSKFTTSDAVIKFYQDKVLEVPISSDHKLFQGISLLNQSVPSKHVLGTPTKRKRTSNEDETLCNSTKKHSVEEWVDKEIKSPLQKCTVNNPGRNEVWSGKQDGAMEHQMRSSLVTFQTCTTTQSTGFQTASALYKQSNHKELSYSVCLKTIQGNQNQTSLNHKLSYGSICSDTETCQQKTGEFCDVDVFGNDISDSECLRATQMKQDESTLILYSEELSECFKNNWTDDKSDSSLKLSKEKESKCFWNLNESLPSFELEDHSIQSTKIDAVSTTPLVIKRKQSKTPSSKLIECQSTTSTNAPLCRSLGMTHLNKNDNSMKLKEEVNNSSSVVSKKYERLQQKSKRKCSMLFEKLKKERLLQLENNIDTYSDEEDNANVLDVDGCEVLDKPLMRIPSHQVADRSASEDLSKSIDIEKSKKKSKQKCSLLFESLKEDISAMASSKDKKLCKAVDGQGILLNQISSEQHSSDSRICEQEIGLKNQDSSETKLQCCTTCGNKKQNMNVVTTEVSTQTETSVSNHTYQEFGLDYHQILTNVPLVVSELSFNTFGFMLGLSVIIYHIITHMYCEEFIYTQRENETETI